MIKKFSNNFPKFKIINKEWFKYSKINSVHVKKIKNELVFLFYGTTKQRVET